MSTQTSTPVPSEHAAEIAAMSARRTAILAEHRSLIGDERTSARLWAIEEELDSMDARLEELGLSLDTLQ